MSAKNSQVEALRRALERIRDEHHAPATPRPCVVCEIVYTALATPEPT